VSFEASLTIEQLSPSSARQVVGEWLTFCRLGKRQPGEDPPEIVLAAAKCFAHDRDKDISDEDWAEIAQGMREKRSRKQDTIQARLNRFPAESLPPGARILNKQVKVRSSNRPASKTEWAIVVLETPAPWPDYTFRFKATQRGLFQALARTRRGLRPAQAPKPSQWQRISPAGVRKLPAYVQFFLRCLATPATQPL
jgi:hypothetical protein